MTGPDASHPGGASDEARPQAARPRRFRRVTTPLEAAMGHRARAGKPLPKLVRWGLPALALLMAGAAYWAHYEPPLPAHRVAYTLRVEGLH